MTIELLLQNRKRELVTFFVLDGIEANLTALACAIRRDSATAEHSRAWRNGTWCSSSSDTEDQAELWGRAGLGLYTIWAGRPHYKGLN
jgi:hypothetical protein